MIIRRAFKYKLKPTKAQREKFLQCAGARRWTYNRGLSERKKAYEATGKGISYYEQNNELVKLKELSETAWLEKIPSQIPQQALKDLDRAFKNFFLRVKKGDKPGYPRFKKKGLAESFRFPQGVKVKGSQAYLPTIGWVKFRCSRPIQGSLKETTLIQEGSGWFVSFSCEWEKEDPSPVSIDEDKAIGIDMGLERFATTSCGKENLREDIENPRFLAQDLSHLKYLSRQLSKKVKKSRNGLKAREKLSKKHAKIKNRRQDFVQKLSTKMIQSHDIFCVESLEISKLLQKSPRGLSRSLSDAGWRSFLHCLKYKAEERGKHFVEAGKYFPSTQICCNCWQRQEMPLSAREYHCLQCKIKTDRDYNSSMVIKAAGMSVLKACGAALIGGSVEAGIHRL